jgi:two-component system CheB/CheR fusion protein
MTTPNLPMSSVEHFMPHGMCLLWQPNLLLMHVISDALIALSYYSIPVALIYFVIKRQDLNFRWLFVLFGLFILACGTTHLLEIWTIWHPDYFLAGLAKIVTAVLSIITAIMLWPFIPLVLKLPSPSTLEHANALLKEEVLEKQRHENQVRLLNSDLEKKVEDRTEALREANDYLKKEAEIRQQVERALRDREEQLQAIVESAADGIITIDQLGKIESVNAAVEAIFGYCKDELVGQNVSCLIPGQDHDKHDGYLAKYLETGVKTMIGTRREAKGVHKNGHEFPMDIAVTEFHRNERYFFTAIIRDITESKRSEHAQMEGDRRKDEFLAMLGHELRNPLTPISNVAQLLSLKTLDGPTLAKACELLTRNVEHITHLVDDLLDVSRITQGKIRLTQERVELVKLLKDSAESIKDLIQTKQQALNFKLPEQPIYLDGDSVRLVQVFSNLLMNATKYTQEGGLIDLIAYVEGPSVIVRVRDNGIGIEPKLLPHIFEIFTQGQRGLDRSEGGLGLGLSLVQKLVELHGGEVTVYSQGTNHGSEFVVKLSRIIEASVKAEPDGALGLSKENGQGLRVLMIDDNQDVLDSISLWLERSGYQVETASNGTQGILVAQSFAPDIVLLDIGLPDMDGYQVAKKLHEQLTKKRPLIIALSGYALRMNDTCVEEAGFDHYLVKPPKLSELQNLIQVYQRTKQSDGHSQQPPESSG